MPTISELVVKISAETSGLKKGTDEASKSLTTLGGKAVDLSKILGPAVMGAAFIAASKAMVDYVSNVAKAADVIDKTSIRTGIATDELQKIKYAAGQTGVAFSAIQSSVTIMTRSLETNEKVFKDLNIQVKNVDGTFRKTDEIFNDTVAVLSDMKDETQRNALALKLFGRGAAEMTPLLDQGSAGIKALEDRASSLGLVMSKDLIKAGVEFGDLTSDLEQATKALGYTFAETLLPALNSIVGGLVKMIQGYVGSRNAAVALNTYLKEGATDSTDFASALAGANTELARLMQIRKDAERMPEMALMSLEEIDKQIAAVQQAKRELDDVARGQEMNKRFAGEAAKAQEAQALAAAKVVAQLEAQAKAEKKYEDSRSKVLNILESEKSEYQKLQDQIDALSSTPWAKGQLEDDRLAAIKALRDKQLAIITEIDEAERKLADERGDEIVKIAQETADKELAIQKANDAKISAAKQSLYSSLRQAMSELSNLVQADSQAEMDAIDRETEAAIAAGADEVTATEAAEKRKAKIKYDADMYSWKSQLALTLVDAAAAIVKGFAQLGPIGGAIAAVGTAAATGIQIAAMNKAKPVAPAFARGTDFAPGGAAIVNEEGPEMINLPRGASVTPATRTPSSGAGNTFVFNSPIALSPSEEEARYTRTVRDLAFQGVL